MCNPETMVIMRRHFRNEIRKPNGGRPRHPERSKEDVIWDIVTSRGRCQLSLRIWPVGLRLQGVPAWLDEAPSFPPGVDPPGVGGRCAVAIRGVWVQVEG